MGTSIQQREWGHGGAHGWGVTQGPKESFRTSWGWELGGQVKKMKGLSRKVPQTKKPHRHRQEHGDNHRARGWGTKKKVKGGQMGTEGALTWGGKHTIQHTDDVLWNCTPETNIMLLTSVTPINSLTRKQPGEGHGPVEACLEEAAPHAGPAAESTQVLSLRHPGPSGS